MLLPHYQAINEDFWKKNFFLYHAAKILFLKIEGWKMLHSEWEPTNNIFEKKIDEDGPRLEIGLDFVGFLEIWKFIMLLKHYF